MKNMLNEFHGDTYSTHKIQKRKVISLSDVKVTRKVNDHFTTEVYRKEHLYKVQIFLS